MSAPTIVFDLDGTLVDTAPDLIATLNLLLVREGVPAMPFVEARKLIGGGAKRLIERALASQGRNACRGEVDRLYGDFVAQYAERIAQESRPFPGVERALDILAERGHRLAVCTNKLEWLSVRLLNVLGLAARFVTICGQDTFGIQKPDPEVLQRTIRATGGDCAAAVMVGDSGTDIATARAAGIPVIAVDFGYSETPVSALGPDRVISHFDALPAAVFELLPPSPQSTVKFAPT